jgi:hypothetical protein
MKKSSNIMTFKKFISYFNLNESLKEIRLNKILDKLSKKQKLSDNEKDFLDNYDRISDEDIMDFKMLSKETTFDKISTLLDENKKVICNLHDRDGKIGLQIISIYNDFGSEESILTLKNNQKVKLKDNLLYNILYNSDKNEWLLEMEDEFYEKIPIKDEN